MKVQNVSAEAHVLSFKGANHLLAAGNFVEIPMTQDEADALPPTFKASGTPIPAQKAEGKKA